MKDRNTLAKERRESVESRKVILRRDGQEDVLTESVIEQEKDPLLKSFARREVGIIEKTKGMPPPHIDIMKRLELVDYEPSSDIGHFRFYPKGALMKDLLEDLAEDVATRRLRAIKIHTPTLYRREQKDIAEQAASFHERDYRITLKDRELLLRFAGDFGLFSMMKSAAVSYKQLPLRIYEISPSFRLEKSGECSGLKRLRAFTMPDIHCFCADLESGLEEFSKLNGFYNQLMRDAELPFAIAFRTVEDFWKTGKNFVADGLRHVKKDGIVEILKEMKHYWNLKNEFQYIDSTEDNIQLSTVQLDISDSKIYGLEYTGKNGKRKPFVIVHSSMGSIERILGAILEERAKEIQNNEKPTFPYWLSPTQLRLIPVTSEDITYCEKLRTSIKNVRVDIDDSPEKIGKKVRAAEREWIPAYMVVGEKERTYKTYTPNFRGKEFTNVQNKLIEINVLQKILTDAQGTRPFRESYQDSRTSKQIRFGNYY